MLKNIVSIRNYGTFTSFNAGNDNWNGCLKKANVIYATNGSGKTSLSILFRSLKGINELILKKKAFGSTEPPSILLKDEANSIFKYERGKWNKYFNAIEIFDSFYVEENIYTITIRNNPDSPSLFEEAAKGMLGDMKDEIRKNRYKLQKLRSKRKNVKKRIKELVDNQKYKEVLVRTEQEIIDVEKVIKKLEARIHEITTPVRHKFLEVINRYLSTFSSDISITEFSLKPKVIVYSIKVNGHSLRTDDENIYSLKYSLSEGDKNALAVSFFFAKLEILDSLKETLVVVDDPFTSFDVHRKTTTINNLSRLISKVGKLVVLTHDLSFAQQLFKKIESDKISLKIVKRRGSSDIIEHDLENESLTGVFKDLYVIRKYLSDGAEDEVHLREVVRCIRPVLEGLFRVKYHDYVRSNQWLGDFIGLIRASDAQKPYYRLKDYLDELSEINDYSKEYHHSNPQFMEAVINPIELNIFCKKTIYMVERI